MENFNDLKTMISSMEEDVIKFYEKGNKAAGVRVRKVLQEVRTLAQAMRLEVSAKNKEA
jgi:hypothetical protein